MPDDDFITVEHIEEEDDDEDFGDEQPVIGIAYTEGKGYSVRSMFTDKLQTAMILTGLANSILENELNGRDARTHRFFGR